MEEEIGPMLGTGIQHGLKNRGPSGLEGSNPSRAIMNEIEAHAFCRNHKESLEKSSQCGCFYCLKIFKPEEIKEWIDKGGKTALCPFCNIDSVVGDASNVLINEKFLGTMRDLWFGI